MGEMADYRLYCRNRAGRIDLADWFAADTDHDAISRARVTKAGARKCEVWHKSRLVARLSFGQVEKFQP